MTCSNRLFLISVSCLIFTAGCTNDPATFAPSGMQLKPCRVSGVESEVKCGTLEVFENRETQKGRKIPLNVVVIPAVSRNKEPDAIFIFAGGPGQAAAELAREILMVVKTLNNQRDLVLVDQRGTGKSNGLDCSFPDLTSQEEEDPEKLEAANKKSLAECRAKLERHADLTQYTTTIAVADIENVRQALDYPVINLWGASYGTRAALEYLRRYESKVRTVVLDGVVPPSLRMPESFARDANQALQKMLAACSDQSACAKKFADLKGTIDTIVTSLQEAPVKITMVDPLSGLSHPMVVTHEVFLSVVFSVLYVPELTALLPAMLAKAKAGDYSALLAIGGQFGDEDSPTKIARGMQLSVMCAEDLPRVKSGNLGLQPPPFKQLFLDELLKACETWPKGSMAKDFDEPVKSSKPVLILSGGLDPVTPPQNGDEVRKSLPNSLHAVAPNIGHGVSMHGCAPKMLKQFVESASVAELDAKCLEKIPRPLFFEPLLEKPKAEQNVIPKIYAGTM